MVRVAFDTNVLVYAEGFGDQRRCGIARDTVSRLDPSSVVVPVQAMGELFNVLTRKSAQSAEKALTSVRSWLATYLAAPTTATCMITAGEIARRHGVPIWDAVMLAASAEANCALLLSEDMHDGFVWQGVTVSNPFADTISPLLMSLLR